MSALVCCPSSFARTQVDYATEGVTANAGEDYVETTGVLTFAPGETEKEISVEIIDDDEPEEDEMFIVKLANPRPNAKLGSEGMTIVTIIDDDDPGLLGFKDEETHGIPTTTIITTMGQRAQPRRN